MTTEPQADIVKVKVVVFVIPKASAVTVMVEVPIVALEEAVSVNVEVQVGVQDMGLNDEVTPEGKPCAEKETDLAVPEAYVAVILFETWEPWAKVLSPPFAKLNSNGGGEGKIKSPVTSDHFCKVSEKRFLKITRYFI